MGAPLEPTSNPQWLSLVFQCLDFQLFDFATVFVTESSSHCTATKKSIYESVVFFRQYLTGRLLIFVNCDSYVGWI